MLHKVLLCCAALTVMAQDRSIVENAQASPNLSTLVSVLTMTEYKPVLDALSGAGPFTVFAPTNAAFEAAGVDVTNVAAVTNVLQYHVISGKVTSSDLKASQEVAALNGKKLVITKQRSTGVMINGKATVAVADVMSSNGVVHVIDQVLLPPADLPSIVANAQATADLSTLVSVLTMTEYKPVLDALSGAGPFTVFAPTNAAFEAAGVDVTNVAAVTNVLQYHVISGKVTSSDLKASQEVVALNGKKLTITKDSNGVMINGKATVAIADVMSSNGVVHVIDQVLLPATTETEKTAEPYSSAQSLAPVGALTFITLVLSTLL